MSNARLTHRRYVIVMKHATVQVFGGALDDVVQVEGEGAMLGDWSPDI